MAATQLESIRIGGTKTSPSYHHHLKNAPESIPVLRHYPIQLTSLTLSSKPSLNPISPNPFKFIPTPKCDPETPYPSIAHLGTQKKTQNPIGLILNAIFNLKKPGTVAIFVSLLILCNPNTSWPATGGRMGGRSFSSGSSSRSSESSSSSFSRSSSSSSYSKPSESSSSSSYSKPSRSSSSSSDSSSVGDGEMVYSESEMVSVEPRMGWNTWVSYSFGFLVFALVVKLLLDYFNESGLESKSSTTISSVIKLQVGLLGTARSLQRELNKIAESADTSAQLGLSYILRETALALLRHPDYCISACSSVDFLESIEEVEKRFDHLSIEEREKLDEETLVNVDNMKKKNVRSTETTEFSNEYLVVTILVAALGAWRLPTINSSQDLKKALRELGSILSSKTLAVEVLWTPQDENDTLSERELLEKYALLRTLEDDDSLT